MSICNRKLTNRGFACSPFCPIYAVGALSVYAILKPLSDNWLLLYLAGAFLATALEYVTAVVMKGFFGTVWWDYRDKPLNYRGVICLESTVAWGFYTVFMFAFLHRFVQTAARSYPVSAGMFLAGTVILIYSVDFMMHLFLARHGNRLPDSLEHIRVRMAELFQRMR